MKETDEDEFKPKIGKLVRQKNKEEIAQEMLKHAAKFPGVYRNEEACNSAHNEAFRAWSREKIRLQEAYDVASTVNVKVFQFAQTIQVQRDGKRRADRMNALQYLNKFKDQVKAMKTLDYDDIEWQRARETAYNLRRKYYERCGEDGIEPIREVPDIPLKPVQRIK